MSVVITLFTVVLLVVSILLVLIVLMQRPKQEGLGAAFGGGMTDQMFGAQTTNVLQKGTVWLAVLFFGVSLLLAIIMARTHKDATIVPDVLKESDPVPAEQAPGAAGDGPSVTIDPEDVTAPMAPAAEGVEKKEESAEDTGPGDAKAEGESEAGAKAETEAKAEPGQGPAAAAGADKPPAKKPAAKAKEKAKAKAKAEPAGKAKGGAEADPKSE